MKRTATLDLLLRSAPRLLGNEKLKPLPREEAAETACRVVAALDNSVFAIQGPPGAGKTYTAARVICTLVAAGKKVGVSAFSHKAIRKVLEQVQLAAIDFEREIRCVQKVSEDSANEDLLKSNPALAALQTHLQQRIAAACGKSSKDIEVKATTETDVDRLDDKAGGKCRNNRRNTERPNQQIVDDTNRE